MPAGDDLSIVYQGSPVAPSDYPVEINENWNWLGTVSNVDLGINEAFTSLSLAQDDYIKNQDT